MTFIKRAGFPFGAASLNLLYRGLSKQLRTYRGSLVTSLSGVSSNLEPFLHVKCDPILYPMPLRNRTYLPGAEGNSFPKNLKVPQSGDDFPLALQANTKCRHSVKDWSTVFREYVDSLLPKHEAILFRNLPLATTEDFQNFFTWTGYQKMEYFAGTGYRKDLGGKVYSASEEPAEFNVELHNDYSYVPVYNKKIILFCLQPAEYGGESAICKNRDILRRLDKAFVQKVEEKKIRYMTNYADSSLSDYITWQNALKTSDKKEAERIVEEKGWQWEWRDDNTFRVWYTNPGFIEHPQTGERVWFNQIHTNHATYNKALPRFKGISMPDDEYPNHTTYGDGEEIEPEYLQQLREVSWESAVGLKLEKGDLLMLDNVSVQHARLSFTGIRTILVGMTYD